MQRPGLSSFSIDSLIGHQQPRLSSVLHNGYMFLPGTTLLPHQALSPFASAGGLPGSLAPNPLTALSPPFAHAGGLLTPHSHPSPTVTQPLSVSVHNGTAGHHTHGGAGTGVHGAFRAYNPLGHHLRGGLGLQPKTGELLPSGLGLDLPSHPGIHLGHSKLSDGHDTSPRERGSSVSPNSRHDSSHSDAGMLSIITIIYQ